MSVHAFVRIGGPWREQRTKILLRRQIEPVIRICFHELCGAADWHYSECSSMLINRRETLRWFRGSECDGIIGTHELSTWMGTVGRQTRRDINGDFPGERKTLVDQTNGIESRALSRSREPHPLRLWRDRRPQAALVLPGSHRPPAFSGSLQHRQ